MAKGCAAWYCPNTVEDQSYNQNLRFYEFPRGQGQRRLLWELAVRSGRRNDDFRSKASTVICSDHFEPRCFNPNRILKTDAVPTLFYVPTWMEEQAAFARAAHSGDVHDHQLRDKRRRRLRRIFLEQAIYRDVDGIAHRSMSFFVLPMAFAHALEVRPIKPMPLCKKRKLQSRANKINVASQDPLALGPDDPLIPESRKTLYERMLATDIQDFAEYEDDDIFYYHHYREQASTDDKHYKTGAEDRKARMEEKSSQEAAEFLTDYIDLPEAVDLKECSILMEPLEDLVKQSHVFTVDVKEARKEAILDTDKKVLYKAGQSSAAQPSGLLSTSQPAAAAAAARPRRKRTANIRYDGGEEVLRAYHPSLAATHHMIEVNGVPMAFPKAGSSGPKTVTMDHKYGRDPRFEGCDPDHDPYKLKRKVQELQEKIKKSQRLLKRSEDKAKKDDLRLKQAEQALAEFEKRELTALLTPAQSLENPIARDIVCCILRNGTSRMKMYTDLVKDFSKAVLEISPKAYAVLKAVLGLPTLRCLKDHKISESTALSRAITSQDFDEDDAVQKAGRKKPTGAGYWLSREAAFKPGKTYPLVLTQEEYERIENDDINFAEYDSSMSRETRPDPSEDTYETSLLVNPPVMLGVPAHKQEPYRNPSAPHQRIRSRPTTSKGKAISGKRKAVHQQVEYDDGDPDYDVEEDSDEDAQQYLREKRAKVATPPRAVGRAQPQLVQPSTSRSRTAGKRLPTQHTTVVHQPQAQYVQPGFDVITTTGGQQWTNPSNAYYQMEHSSGGVHYVQTVPIAVEQTAQNTQFITTSDLSKIIDMGGYH